MPAHDNAKPWTPEEDQLLEQLLLDPRMRNKNGQMQWGGAVQAFQAAGFARDKDALRCRRDRLKQGREKVAKGVSTKLCTKCGQIKAGHVCTGPTGAQPKAPGITKEQIKAALASVQTSAMNSAASSSGFSAGPTTTATAVPALTPEQAAARDAAIALADRAEESYRAELAQAAAMVEAVASNTEPTAATDLTPAPPASRPITPVNITPPGDAARAAPAGGTVRPPSPSYGFQPVPPPVLAATATLDLAVAAAVLLAAPVQRMPSIPLDAMDPSMGTFGTTIAPPDEPTPLDVDHLERTRFSPPHDPFAPSDGESMFEGRPSFDPSGTPDGSAAGGGFY